MNMLLEWAEKNFGNAKLFNRTKTQRVVKIAAKLAANPGTSLGGLFHRWYDTKATYTLLKQDIMTPSNIQSNHRELVYEDIKKWTGDVLAIEDASEFDWSNKDPIEGLGPVGAGGKFNQGFILHSTLAVGICNENYGLKILGLPYQQYYVRPPKRKVRKNRSKTNEYLETDLWREIINKKALPPKDNVIRICDRGADIYEVMDETTAYGCSHIIRLKHDRLMLEPSVGRIKETMKNLVSMGQTTIVRRGRDGVKKREVTINFCWHKVSIQAPARPGIRIGKLPNLEETVVYVWGIDPETNELIEWYLYTNIEVNTLEDAIKIVKYYSIRWTIEDYHKALKSGLKAEKLQLETAHSLFAAIAIMSIVALKLVYLRESLRVDPKAPAKESGFSEFELKVLGAYLKRDLKTVRCVALAIGSLGGHLNRKSDGMPGILSLWRGIGRLLSIVEGARLIF